MELQDVIKFRTEIDLNTDYLETEFFLKAELYLMEPNTKVSVDAIKEEIEKSEEGFKMVQARMY